MLIIERKKKLVQMLIWSRNRANELTKSGNRFGARCIRNKANEKFNFICQFSGIVTSRFLYQLANDVAADED